ncbi:MAG: nucleotidyltransferase domain-containing protein [Bacteroidales bacterium]|jgi:predicted nucleotidyltransferase|nr:nucleotidyltransferase domain-containing protein [Bacteroidales bacterium]
MDEKATIIKKVRQYKNIVKSNNIPLSTKNVYLFGSYAKGYSTANSDIDVAFIVDSDNSDYSEVTVPLWKLRRKIDMRIEPHIIARDTDYSGMITEIQKTGIKIN